MSEKLLEHIGHKIEIAQYGEGESVTVECIDCGCVIVAAEDYA